jgi:NADH:ubiquinone oxidoreductase subunit D
MNEMCESLNIINQAVNKVTDVNQKNIKSNRNTKISPHNVITYLNKNKWNGNVNKNSYNSMENLIHHFKY